MNTSIVPSNSPKSSFPFSLNIDNALAVTLISFLEYHERLKQIRLCSIKPMKALKFLHCDYKDNKKPPERLIDALEQSNVAIAWFFWIYNFSLKNCVAL